MADDPIPGDYYRCKGFEFRIDFIQAGEVYYVRWKLPIEGLGNAGRIPLEQWRDQMKEAERIAA